MLFQTTYQSPLGPLRIVDDGSAITQIRFAAAIDEAGHAERPSHLAAQAICQLNEYFAGQRQQFTLPLAPAGTPFQQRVWQALSAIPYGQTCTYREIAQRISCPGGMRAVGNANHNNPIVVVIPCHRVIGANGKLVGYGGGLENKQWLLELEQADPGQARK